MATIHNFEGKDSLTAAVARRLRGLLAEERMSKTDFASRLGWDRGYLYRRLSGATPMTTADLDAIEHTVRFRAEYLIGGHGPKLNPPPFDGVPMTRNQTTDQTRVVTPLHRFGHSSAA